MLTAVCQDAPFAAHCHSRACIAVHMHNQQSNGANETQAAHVIPGQRLIGTLHHQGSCLKNRHRGSSTCCHHKQYPTGRHESRASLYCQLPYYYPCMRAFAMQQLDAVLTDGTRPLTCTAGTSVTTTITHIHTHWNTLQQ